MTKLAIAASLAIFTLTTAANAGPITRACLKSDRAGANRSTCGCIQAAPDRVLTGRDQRIAAKFFKKPDMAQDIRMSKTGYHNEFWDRYKEFGAVAEATCS